MSYKIFEQNGIEIENIDGAALNNLIAGSESGIVSKVKNECNLIAYNNVLTLDTGLIIVSGFRVKIESPMDFTLAGTPAFTTQYQLILQITLNKDRSVIGDFFVREEQSLIQDNLFINEEGIYQFEIATFKHNTDGTINDIQKAKLLSGNENGSGSGGGFTEEDKAEIIEELKDYIDSEILGGAW